MTSFHKDCGPSKPFLVTDFVNIMSFNSSTTFVYNGRRGAAHSWCSYCRKCYSLHGFTKTHTPNVSLTKQTNVTSIESTKSESMQRKYLPQHSYGYSRIWDDSVQANHSVFQFFLWSLRVLNSLCDIIITETDHEKITRLKRNLFSHFQTKNLRNS